MALPGARSARPHIGAGNSRPSPGRQRPDPIRRLCRGHATAPAFWMPPVEVGLVLQVLRAGGVACPERGLSPSRGEPCPWWALTPGFSVPCFASY